MPRSALDQQRGDFWIMSRRLARVVEERRPTDDIEFMIVADAVRVAARIE